MTSALEMRRTKCGLRRATTAVDLPALLRYESENIRTAIASEDARGFRQAVFEQRTPAFKGTVARSIGKLLKGGTSSARGNSEPGVQRKGRHIFEPDL